MHLHEFINITHNFESLWNYLCDKNVVHKKIMCPKCKNEIQLSNLFENHIFHCTKKYHKIIKGRKSQKLTCNFKISAFHGTWFSRRHMDLTKICRFIAYFLIIRPPRHRFLKNELEIKDHCVVDWTNFCRELLQQWIIPKQTAIGGQNTIVELDEVKIGKRKYNTERIIRGQWVFGGIERETKKVFIVPVANRNPETLLPIIQQYVAPGSIIYTDKWRAYNSLDQLNYTHKTVNDTVNFDPETGIHTQNIKILWKELRANTSRYSIRDYHFIAEFLFKRTYKYDERIDMFFNIMSLIYPLNDLNFE